MSNVLYGNFKHKFTSERVEKQEAGSRLLWGYFQAIKEQTAGFLEQINRSHPGKGWMKVWSYQNLRKTFTLIKGSKDELTTNN